MRKRSLNLSRTSLTGLFLAISAPASAQSHDPVLWRVTQESTPGAADFDTQPASWIRPWVADTTTAIALYAYNTPNASSYNGTTITPVSERSHVFLARTIEGLSLCWIHDAVNDGTGGLAETRVVLSGARNVASRLVRDDPGEGWENNNTNTRFTSSSNWDPCCTDGYVIATIDAATMAQGANPASGASAILAFENVNNNMTDSIFAGLNEWIAYSADRAETFGLDISGLAGATTGSPGRRVELRPCISVSPVTPVWPCPRATTVSLSVQAFTTTPRLIPPIYRWFKNGVLIPAGTPRYSGMTTATLTIANPRAGDDTSYTCEVTNPELVSGPGAGAGGGSSICGTVISLPGALTFCIADFNCDGAVAVQDIFNFLAAWFGLDPAADIDGINGVALQDLFDFLALYFTGCA